MNEHETIREPSEVQNQWPSTIVLFILTLLVMCVLAFTYWNASRGPSAGQHSLSNVRIVHLTSHRDEHSYYGSQVKEKYVLTAESQARITFVYGSMAVLLIVVLVVLWMAATNRLKQAPADVRRMLATVVTGLTAFLVGFVTSGSIEERVMYEQIENTQEDVPAPTPAIDPSPTFGPPSGSPGWEPNNTQKEGLPEGA